MNATAPAIEYTRQRDWFDPDKTQASVTMVGCGGIGSFAAFALAKLGVQRMALVDFDTVEEHNIPNQLFSRAHLGSAKIGALANTIQNHSDTASIQLCDQRLEDGVPLNDVVVSALDSMDARAALWQQVKYKVACQLFLDARLAGEYVVLYAVNPLSPTDIEGYEATLHSDEEGLDLPCTGRAVIDVGFAVGSLITRAVRKHYAREDVDRVTFLNQSTLSILKGGWS